MSGALSVSDAVKLAADLVAQREQELDEGMRAKAEADAARAQAPTFGELADQWIALRQEDVIDPERPIVDAHHHLWDRGGQRYMIEEITGDIASGHNIVATVYVDCRSYRDRRWIFDRSIPSRIMVRSTARISAASPSQAGKRNVPRSSRRYQRAKPSPAQ